MKYLTYIFLLIPFLVTAQVGASQQQAEVALLALNTNLDVTTHRGDFRKTTTFTALDPRVGGTSIALFHVPFHSGGEDISTHARVLTTIGTPVGGTGAGFGTGKGYIQFDGATDGLDYGNWNINTGNNQLSGVVSFSVAPGNVTGVLLGLSTFATHANPFYNWLQMAITTNPAINDHAHSRVNLETGNTTLGTVADNNVVHNYMLTWSNGTPNKYLDGVLDNAGQSGAGTLNNSTQNIRIGTRHTPTTGLGEFLNGRVAYAMLMNRVPSAAFRTNLTGQIIPNTNNLPPGEFSSTEVWNYGVYLYDNGTLVRAITTNAITIP